MIRVVVVEDSQVQRAHLVHTLQAERDIVVVGQAERGQEAIELVTALAPDVVTLDLQIPDGGGKHVIEQLMAYEPVPILVLSATLTGRQSEAAVEALVAGAVDAIPKPAAWDTESERQLRAAVRMVSGVTVVRHPRGSLAARRRPPRPSAVSQVAVPVVALAASTGGPAALAQVLSGLGGLDAAVLVVQHIHAEFVQGFVDWMARASALPVELATDGQRLRRGVVVVAPGDVHLGVGAGGRIVLDPEPRTIHRPSADVLFSSIAAHARGMKVGVVLTGMGDDGAAGLLELRRRGGFTFAQDEASSAVFGMPQAAQALGAVKRLVPLDQVARTITRSLVSEQDRAS